MTSSLNQSRCCTSSRDLKIIEVKAWFDCKEIIVDETSNSVLKYRTPKFRALATVEVPPLAADEEIEIGWIQVCTSLKFVNQYGTSGLTSWELPELSSGVHHMVSDSDGKRYPWYGRRHEVVRLQGPLALPTPVTVYMHDSFRPQVTWYVPVSVGADANSAGSRCRVARLTQVRRRQHFLTYLAAIRRRSPSTKAPTDDNCRPLYSRPNDGPSEVDRDHRRIVETLKAVSWFVDVEIDVDPSQPLGCRVKTVGPGRQRQPTLIDPIEAPSLADNALRPPNANSSQTLVWWPSLTAAERTVGGNDVDGGKCLQSSTRIGRLPRVVIRSVSTAVRPDAAARTYLNARSGHFELLQAMVDKCRIK